MAAPRTGPQILLLLLGAVLGGCAHDKRACVPPEVSQSARFLDVNAPAAGYRAVEPDGIAELLAWFEHEDRTRPPHPRPLRQHRILALSGGGAYGAFTVGVLNGWTCAGTRPEFDVVTGISTGGLIATLAFLGSAHDPTLREMYTSVSKDDIYRERPRVALLWADSAASSEPLKRIIDSQIDAAVLQAVARAHCQGRRLYLGTTNLDTRRLVIWDMGAISASGRPDALELYRKIVLASASVPGFFPPVLIDVEINGQRYTELHGDGAATNQVFLRGSMLHLDREALRAGQRPLAGSAVYVIIAGKLYVDGECTEPRVTSIAASALSSLTAAQTRNDLVRIWTLCMLTGMSFHMAAVPQHFPTLQNSLSFDPAEMKRLYEEGYRQGCSGRDWRHTPPGTDPSEQVVPRTGTEFIGPVLDASRPPSPGMR